MLDQRPLQWVSSEAASALLRRGWLGAWIMIAECIAHGAASPRRKSGATCRMGATWYLQRLNHEGWVEVQPQRGNPSLLAGDIEAACKLLSGQVLEDEARYGKACLQD